MKDNNYQGESFLNRIYKDLHITDEVMHTASLSDTKDEKVRKYLERIEKVEELAKNSKYNGIELLKEMYYKKYVIKPENVPESYFEMQKKIALERGFGHVDITENERKQMLDVIINDQKKSLDIWLDYFLSCDTLYPEWFKYYAFQGMLKLGSYDKSRSSFNKRTDKTVNVFVDLNREVLALVYDNLCDVLNGKQVDDEVLQKLLENGSFSKLYAYILKKIEESKKDILAGTDGIWIKYDKGSKPEKLVKSLEGKGTGWCTAGIETARKQLEGGNFYVYYTKDSSGEYKQPRIAIRMEDNSIAEIRGISEHQNLESDMEEVLDKKLEEFPDKDEYKKKVNDMEKLTTIYKEYKDRDLTTDELRFLYEIDNKIDGFGYEKDPRIKEILLNRDFKKDLARVFDCGEDEVSNDVEDVFKCKKIICFYGDLILKDYTGIEDILLPENVYGDLYLDKLRSTQDIVLPKAVSGDLYLSGLTTIDGLVLPKSVGGNIDLRSLESAEGLILPEIINGNLDLDSLLSAKGLILPKVVNGNLILRSLESAVGLILPNEINGDLHLDRLRSGRDLVLHENINGYICLRRLTDIENLVFPKCLNGSLELYGLRCVDGLILPEVVNGRLDLGCLITAKNLTLPNYISGCLYLHNLKNAQNVIFPNKVEKTIFLNFLLNVDGLVIPKDFECGRLDSNYITMEDLMFKSLESNYDRRQKG